MLRTRPSPRTPAAHQLAHRASRARLGVSLDPVVRGAAGAEAGVAPPGRRSPEPGDNEVSTSHCSAHRHRARADMSSLLACRGDVVEGAGVDQLVDGAARARIVAVLVLRPLPRHADVAHILGDPGDGLVDAGRGLGGGKVALMVSFLMRKRRPSPAAAAEARTSFASAPCTARAGPSFRRSAQRNAAPRAIASFARSSWSSARACLAGDWSLAGPMLERVGLQLDALAGGGDVREPAAPSGELELAFVAVVQRSRGSPPGRALPALAWKIRLSCFIMLMLLHSDAGLWNARVDDVRYLDRRTTGGTLDQPLVSKES